MALENERSDVFDSRIKGKNVSPLKNSSSNGLDLMVARITRSCRSERSDDYVVMLCLVCTIQPKKETKSSKISTVGPL